MARPPFNPTPEQRKLVLDLAAATVSEDEIRQIVPWGQVRPIDGKTLRKHFSGELERGHAMSNARVKRKLHELIDQGNVAATIFYLKARCGWSESVRVEASGPGGGPLAAVTLSPVLYLPAKDEAGSRAPHPALVEPQSPPAKPNWREQLASLHSADPAPRIADAITRGELARGADAADPRQY